MQWRSRKRFFMARFDRSAKCCSRNFALFLVGAALLSVTGCGGVGQESRVSPPAFSPEQAAKEAMAQYDSNRDGFLAGQELESCPALKNNLTSLDTDKDGRLSESEIAEGLRNNQKQGIGLMTVRCRVTLDGSPLAGATVRFVPEGFLGSGFKPASGITNGRGMTEPTTEGRQTPGLAPGFYRVEVTNAEGQPELPARYNRTTELGQEINSVTARGPINLALTSR